MEQEGGNITDCFRTARPKEEAYVSPGKVQAVEIRRDCCDSRLVMPEVEIFGFDSETEKK